MGKITNHFDKVLSSLKYQEVEEKYDIYFSRFFGLYLANMAKYLGLTPTQVTVTSLFVGIIGGGLLYFQNEIVLILVAGFLITLAGLLDSADGQLARMTGQTSEFGRILDGEADSFVFAACYVGGTAFFVFETWENIWLVPLAMAAGYMQALKSSVYDFYKNEFLYYCGEKEDSRVLAPYEVKQKQRAQGVWYVRIAYVLYYNYVKAQFQFNSRSMQTLTVFRGFYENTETKQLFQKQYYERHLGILSWWAWFGGLNTFRWGIIVSCLFGRFDIFLWVGLISSVGFLYTLVLEKRADKRILSSMNQSPTDDM